MTTTTKQLTPVDQFRNTLDVMSKDLKAALPSHVTPEKFNRVVLTAIRTNPKLLDLDRTSLLGAVMMCAQDGLLPDGREGAIVPFKGQAKWMPMVAGICKKVRNSGELISIDAQVVYEKDVYRAWTDEKGPHFTHERARGDRGEVVLTFAYAITKDGGFFFEEIDEDQMAAIENSSRANDGPWKSAFKDEMRRKSAIRRLAKFRLPTSSDLDDVIRRDDDLYEVESKDVTPSVPKTTSSRLSKLITAETKEPQQEPPTQITNTTVTPENDVPL